MTKKITIQLPKGFLEILDQYTDKGTFKKDIKELAVDCLLDGQGLKYHHINHIEGYGVTEQVTVLIFKAYLAGMGKGKEKAIEVLSSALVDQNTELPDDCKVANKEHCFLSGKCKQCEFTVPQ